MSQALAPAATAPRRSLTFGWRLRHRLRRALARPAPAGEPAVPHDSLAAVLLAHPADTIAFDIFDTLVCRSITPEHVKRLALARLARRLGLKLGDAAGLYEARRRIEAELCRGNADLHGELEFRHADMARELHAALAAQGLTPLPEAADFAALLLACEVAVEREVLRPIPGAAAALAALRAAERRLVAVSDFYLPEVVLRGLLARCGISLEGVPLFVSADHMASKRSGRLYQLVLGALGLSPPQLMMVGDNAHSDIAMARAAGCAALQVDAAAQHAFYARAEAGVCSPLRARTAWREAVGAAPGLRGAAPALVLFIERLYAAARQDGLRHLFFLAREGQVLLRLFERYQDCLGLAPGERIACHYLLASRRACYIASLGPLEAEEFALLFRQYRRISLGEFLASLRIPAEQAGIFAQAIGTTLDAVEEDFPTSACFARLRALPAFAAAYEALRHGQQANFRAYLAGFGVDFARHPLALVDVGWKGTIQDCIAAALGAGVTLQGYYLGLLQAGQEMAGKRGLLFSNIGHATPGFRIFAENRALFEILLHADHGSALSYERLPDGRVEARLEAAPEELDYISRSVAPVAAAVVASAEALMRLRHDSALPEHEWERFVLDCHADLVFRPWDTSAAWLLQASHRENFGVFRLSSFRQGAAPGLPARLRWTLRLLRRPREMLQPSFWPALTLHRQGSALLAWLYGWRQRRVERRALAAAP
ncbi:HAD family hydrolase [Siccirubricoccus phaeus]|uniref:HAD family hydrolase n=1 Tax=Siccirubricoccus phaeus TaxID=2595053 RepID=UPI0011F0E3E9|nr:HAD family hydrolase [Siccirubricoccus phaeus]